MWQKDKNLLQQEQTGLTDYLNRLLLDSTISTLPRVAETKTETETVVVSQIDTPVQVSIEKKQEIQQVQPQRHDFRTDARYLIAQTSSLSMALPLIQIRHVQALKGRAIHRLHQSHEYVYGYTRFEHQHIPVFNLEKLLNYQQMPITDEMPSHALVLENWSLAIGLSAVDEVHTIAEDEIVWRKRSPKNPWHAGICKQHSLLSVIDLDMAGRVLHSLLHRRRELA